MTTSSADLNWIANYIWGIADDVLRDLYVRGKYRDVILPMTVLRRLDAVLEDTKQAVLDMKALLDKAGVARSSDGQMLFLANKLSKMKRDSPLGSRIAEVHNGSSLFTGDAGQGESNIRRWIIENDWLEAIVALPLNMFYNTGIATYVWVLTNRKPDHRRGKVQLIDATKWHRPLRKNLGKKNCELGDEDIARICETFLAFEETEESRIFDNAAFGYWKVTVERPLRIVGADPDRAYKAAEIFLNFLIPKLPAPEEEDLSKGILDAIDMDSYRVEKRAMQQIMLPDEDAEIEPVPASGSGHRPEPELDRLSNILKAFNDLFGDIAWQDRDRVGELITKTIPAQVAADAAFRNARQNSDDANARIEHDRVLPAS